MLEEDSVALETIAPRRWPAARVCISVVRHPRFADFTDLAPLEAEPDVEVRDLDEPSGLEPDDLLMLSGSEDTLANLRHLKARGFAARRPDAGS